MKDLGTNKLKKILYLLCINTNGQKVVIVIHLCMYVHAHEQYFFKRNESLCAYVTLGFVITQLNFSGECSKQKRAREPLQKNKKITKALPNLSSGTLGDN